MKLLNFDKWYTDEMQKQRGKKKQQQSSSREKNSNKNNTNQITKTTIIWSIIYIYIVGKTYAANCGKSNSLRSNGKYKIERALRIVMYCERRVCEWKMERERNLRVFQCYHWYILHTFSNSLCCTEKHWQLKSARCVCLNPGCLKRGRISFVCTRTEEKWKKKREEKSNVKYIQ